MNAMGTYGVPRSVCRTVANLVNCCTVRPSGFSRPPVEYTAASLWMKCAPAMYAMYICRLKVLADHPVTSFPRL